MIHVSTTGVVKKVNLLVAASNIGVLRWRKNPHRTLTEIACFEHFP